jgi:hypothetical protein
MNFNINSDSNTSNLIQRLILNKTDPLHNFNYNQQVSAFGSVTPNSQYQITPNAPMNFINPQLNGDIRTPQMVQPRNVVMTKYDNKRKNTEEQIALFDWRNNTSLNNAGKVPANYYQEQLTKTAKDKVRTKQMMNGYSTQYNSQVNAYDEFDRDAITPKQVYDSNAIQKKDVNYVLDYSDLSTRMFTNQINSNPPTYNPMLPKTSLNKPIDDPSFADERITHGNSDRPYTTKGDRLLQARELATSESIKERNQLQIEAQQALTGAVKAPRLANPNIGMGIKSQFYNTDNTKFEDNSHKIKTNKQPINNINNLTNDKYNDTTINTTIKHQENSINNHDKITERYGLNQQTIDLNLYGGRSSDLTKQNRLKQTNDQPQFDYIANQHRNKSLDPTAKKRFDENKEYKSETFISKFIEGLKSFFYNDTNKTTVNRKEITEDKYNSRYYDSDRNYKHFNTVSDIDQGKYISDYNKNQHRHKYWVINDETKFEFDTEDGVYQKTLIKEPIAVLLDDENINRNLVIRDIDSVKVYQRKDNMETGLTEYNVITIPFEMMDDVLKEHILVENRKQVKHDDLKTRLNDNIIDLDYEDHIKIGILTEQAPDDFKLQSKEPISYHQRILLDQLDEIPTNIITNLDNIDDYLHNKFKTDHVNNYFNRDEVNGKNNKRDYLEDDNNKQFNYHIQFDNNVLKPKNQDHKMGIKMGKHMDPRDITKRFNQN